MDQTEPFRPLPDAWQGKQRKPTIILISSALLCTTWRYFGRFPFYQQHLAPHLTMLGDPGAVGAVYTFFWSFLLLGLVPALIVKFVFREKLADYGVRLGNWRIALGWLALMAPVWLVAAHLGSTNPHVVQWYPINRSAGQSPAMFGFHALTYLIFYMGYEFHFRGYVQFGLRESVGEMNALLIQVVMTVLIHTGKPLPNEAFGSMFAGMLWGVLNFRARSLLPGLLQHFLLGISLDLFICLR
ncbi:MAG TPA: hypothetical protein EYP56_14455 [Planctomycetaceae bacterium]|nr:hypothetical protein [Planctomycetaceae bacterium]